MEADRVARAADRRKLAIAALLAGATCIGTSALFVKVSEAGPVSTAFWRVFLALPFLWAWAWLAQHRAEPAARGQASYGLMFAAGFFFAGDLAVWHSSIVLTSVANATLLANLAPIFVTLAAWLLWKKKPTLKFLAGLGAALAGVILLIGGDFSHTASSSGKALLGDALGVVTAMFYAAYQLAVTRLRGSVSTAHVMAVSSVVTAALLLPLAWLSGEAFFPASTAGWIKLFALALISQVAGQSLIAYAMAHLPATLSSVGLLLQPVMAGVFAWILLGETLGAAAIAGGILVLIGIRMATLAESTQK